MPDKDPGREKLSPVIFYYFNLTGHSDTMSGSLSAAVVVGKAPHDRFFRPDLMKISQQTFFIVSLYRQ